MNELVPLTSKETATALRNYSEAAEGAFSANTERALASDTQLWTSWCSDNGYSPLPAAPEAVVAFINAMADKRKLATIARYLSSLAHMHRAANLADLTKSNEVTLAMRALRRSKPTRQRQAAPLNANVLERLTVALTGPNSLYLFNSEESVKLSKIKNRFAIDSHLHPGRNGYGGEIRYKMKEKIR